MKPIWITAGSLALLLGLIGAFLPILPTTPFILLAAFCFSKSSDRLHRWILSNPTFGPMVSDWEKYGMVKRKPKIIATVMIVLLFGLSLCFMQLLLAIKILMIVIAIAVLIFIWTRPEHKA